MKDKIINILDGFRHTFKILFDGLRFSCIYFDDMNSITNTKIIINRG